MKFTDNQLFIFATIGAIVLFCLISAIDARSTEVQSVDPCKLTVITDTEGKVTVVRPTSLDYDFCKGIQQEETKRIPASNRLFGKKCHKKH